MSDFKGTVKIRKEIYYNGDTNWGIYQSKVISISEKAKNVDTELAGDYITVKGLTPQLETGEEYLLTADYSIDQKYGPQLSILCIARTIDQYPTTPQDKRKVLSNLFTSKQIDAMYEAYPEPYDILMEGDANKLVKIKGCGLKNAVAWMERFNDFVPLNKIYIELERYQLTNNMIKKLLEQYKSADLVIEKVKNNPYCLCELKGVGWKTADKIAMQGGLPKFSLERIKSFILSYLEQQGSSGYSYVEPSELMAAIIENIGEDVPDFAITESIHSLDKMLFWNESKTLIGLKKYWDLENKISKEVIRLLKAQSNLQYRDLEETKSRLEAQQGWEFTSEQVEGVQMAMEHNFIIINGGAGTGKSTLVNLFLSLLNGNVLFAQTALSGRAAARLAEVTHKEGYTIHRLLGFPLGDDRKGKFLYHDENQLQFDVIIVDEISMIGGRLFYDLLRAIKSGCKVILLGDTGQLEAIGECNVAHDLLACEFIPRVTLTKCHRQAMKSAIITESMKVRQGTPIINKGWVGVETRGELQDLTLDCYSDASNTYHKVIRYFTNILKKEKDIMNIQVLSPIKTRGDSCIYQLNLALQAIYNPKEKEEIVVRNSEGMVYGIQQGDKVINTQNNYGVSLAYDEDSTTDIFNGNIGIVKEVNSKGRYMIIDFQDVGVVRVSQKDMNNIELAYATSVHKYQGSECENVIIALDFSSYTLLSRELVYTAITRAKKNCVLVAQNKALSYAVSNPSTICKRTYLTEILNGSLQPKIKFIF